LETETKMTPKTEGTKIGKLNKDVKKMSDKEGSEPRMKTHKNIITPQVMSRLKPNIENFILFLSDINIAEANPKKNETKAKMPIAK
jgi:hypothetical protein